MLHARWPALGALLLLFVSILVSDGPSPAADAEAADNKKTREDVDQLADLIKKGKKDDARKKAEELARDKKITTKEVMELLGTRWKSDGAKAPKVIADGGYGFDAPAAAPGIAFLKEPNNAIEGKLGDLNNPKRPKGPWKAADLKNEAPLLEKAAYRIIAVAEITKLRGPKKAYDYHPDPDDQTQKKKQQPADWDKWAKEMNETGTKLLDALKTNKVEPILNAAKNAEGSCTSCHTMFRSPDDGFKDSKDRKD